MREIKFRAWDKNRREWSNTICGMNLYPSVITEIQPIEANKHLELMQFTGLKDKNGKDIFEGDILKNHKYGGVAEVIWSNDTISDAGGVADPLFGGKYNLTGFFSSLGEFSLKWPEGKPHKAFYIQDTEIIGNIYENPELLTPSKEDK